MDNRPPVTFTFQLDRAHALALAQFLKRVSFETAKRHSVPTDPEEPYFMLAALETVREALANEGFAPR